MPRYGIEVPDRQLACAPVDSPEGRAYLGAMAAAANYGRANRQLLVRGRARRVRAGDRAARLDLVYDVSHNLAKIETHEVDGQRGAVRPPQGRHPRASARPSGPAAGPREVGQPVLIPGTMGTASYVLARRARRRRVRTRPATAPAARMSRTSAAKRSRGRTLRTRAGGSGHRGPRAARSRGLAEEAPYAYKDVDAVVATCEGAGLCRARRPARPLGVVKG